MSSHATASSRVMITFWPSSSSTATPSIVASSAVGGLSVSGADVNFNNVLARAVRVASLAEIEVIARGE